MRETLRIAFFFLLCLPLLAAGGCIQRTVTVRSNPTGALVYLNDQEIGRTPVTRNLTWYGTYEVEVRKEGFQSVKATAMVWAPWWQWVPFDLLTEFLPVQDRHELHYTLHEPTTRQSDPDELIGRGEQLRGELQSSQRPTTLPTTKPAKRRKTNPPAGH